MVNSIVNLYIQQWSRLPPNTRNLGRDSDNSKRSWVTERTVVTNILTA